MSTRRTTRRRPGSRLPARFRPLPLAAACAIALVVLAVGGAVGAQRFVPRPVLFGLWHSVWLNRTLSLLEGRFGEIVGAGQAISAAAAAETRDGRVFPNGIDPPASFVPYAPTSPWNRRVCNAANRGCRRPPRDAPYSETVIGLQFGPQWTCCNGEHELPMWSVEAGIFDYSHPVYYAAPSDPLVQLRCEKYCGRAGVDYPRTMRIPAPARPAEGEDGHLAVIQPNGEEIDFWAVSAAPGNGETPRPGPPGRDWRTGDTIVAQAVAACGNYLTGSGFAPRSPAATAGGACLGGGLIRPNELLAGRIAHALFLAMACSFGPGVYPNPDPGNPPDNACRGGIGAPFGARLWYDVPDATTDADPRLAGWEKTVLNALHDYGAYNMDTGGGAVAAFGMQFLVSSSEVGFAYTGDRSRWAEPLRAIGAFPNVIRGVQPAWGPISATRWTLSNGWRPQADLVHHLHWLDPCSARGTC